MAKSYQISTETGSKKLVVVAEDDGTISVSAFNYFDGSGTLQALPSSSHILMGAGARVVYFDLAVTTLVQNLTSIGQGGEGLFAVVANDSEVVTNVVEAQGSSSGGGSGVSVSPQNDSFTPTLGQVSFILSSAPSNNGSLEFRVNGAEYDQGTDYTISGATVSWISPIVLEPTDTVVIEYTIL